MSNRRVLLNDRPRDRVGSEHFIIDDRPLSDLGPDEVRVRVLWCSFDPAQRGWINDVPSYMPPVALGEVMRAFAVGRVEESRDPAFAPGDLVEGLLGWQQWWQGAPSGVLVRLAESDRPERYLGALGTTGLTAYFGMLDIGQPRDGDVVLVTAAAGATGSVAGQIARIQGTSEVIGTAGSPGKLSWLTEVAGFSQAIDHYQDKVGRAIREAAPNGFDVVYDNVGGSLLDSALSNIAVHARIVLCGAISTGYRPERPEVGLRNYQLLTTRRARMEGFLLSDFSARFAEAREMLGSWLDDGRLVVEQDVVSGLDQAPDGLQRLFDGGNLGKLLLKVDHDD